MRKKIGYSRRKEIGEIVADKDGRHVFRLRPDRNRMPDYRPYWVLMR